MLNKLAFSLFILTGFAIPANAQLNKDLFPLDRQFKRGGFYIAPELNYLLTISDFEETASDNQGSYNYKVEPAGDFGYGLEIGWFHSFSRHRFVDYLEMGIGYRNFKGSAEHTGNYKSDTLRSSFSSSNTLSVQLAQLSFRATHVIQTGRHSLFTQSLGLNGNYFFSEKYIRDNPRYIQRFESFSNNPLIQLHLALGYAFQVSKKVLLIPSIESPLLNVYPIELRSGFEFFSAAYQPLIFKLRIQLLREDPVNCNAPTFNGPQPGF